MQDGASPLAEATISTRLLTRIVTLLVALWSLFAGVVLVAAGGSGASALGAGVEDRAGQRLVGAHLLILVPAYLLLVWQPERFKAFTWLPYAAQMAVVLVVGYDILSGETDFGDGILALAVGLIFVALLGFLWITEQRTEARLKLEARAASEPDKPPM